jgi:hypothetical protein
MDESKLWDEILNGQLWGLLGAAALLGAIGALLHPATTEASDEARVQTDAKHGWRDVAAGAVAAIAIIYTANPTSATALVAGSLVAGYAANAVLAGFESRVRVAKMTERAASSDRVAVEARQRADASAELARTRDDVARRATYALDEIARASDRGFDVKPIVNELRAKRLLSADAS